MPCSSMCRQHGATPLGPSCGWVGLLLATQASSCVRVFHQVLEGSFGLLPPHLCYLAIFCRGEVMGSAPDVGDILKQVRSCARRQIGAAQIESCLLPAAHLQSSPVWCCLSSSAPTCMLHHIAHKVAFVVTRTLSGSSSAALLQGQAVSLKLNWHQCFQHRRSCVWQVSSIVEGTCNPDLSLGYTEMLGEPLAHRADEVWIRTECNTTATEAFDTLCLSPLFSLRACLPFEDAP